MNVHPVFIYVYINKNTIKFCILYNLFFKVYLWTLLLSTFTVIVTWRGYDSGNELSYWCNGRHSIVL